MKNQVTNKKEVFENQTKSTVIGCVIILVLFLAVCGFKLKADYVKAYTEDVALQECKEYFYKKTDTLSSQIDYYTYNSKIYDAKTIDEVVRIVPLSEILMSEFTSEDAKFLELNGLDSKLIFECRINNELLSLKYLEIKLKQLYEDERTIREFIMNYDEENDSKDVELPIYYKGSVWTDKPDSLTPWRKFIHIESYGEYRKLVSVEKDHYDYDSFFNTKMLFISYYNIREGIKEITTRYPNVYSDIQDDTISEMMYEYGKCADYYNDSDDAFIYEIIYSDKGRECVNEWRVFKKGLEKYHTFKNFIENNK